MGALSDQLTLAELTELADSASDVTFTGSLDGRVTWVSDGVAELIGWAPDDVLDQPFVDLVLPEDRQLTATARLTADAGGTGRFRARVRTKDSGYHWVDVRLRTRFDESGRPLSRYGSWHDADSDVQHLSSLAHEVDRNRQILDGMLDPWVLFAPVRNADGLIVDFVFADANARACEYNRVRREDLVGHRLLDLLPAHRGSELFAMYVHSVESGEPLILDDFTYPREIFGGAERRYDIRAVRVAEGLSYSWRDVTSRYESHKRVEESEAKFAAALASEIDPHAFFAPVRNDNGAIIDLCFEEANVAAAEYVGVPQGELRGLALSSFGSPAFAPLLAAIAPVIDTGVPLTRDAWPLNTLHSGARRWLDVRAVKAGEGVSMIWRDVTDRVRIQESLAESEERYRMLSQNASEMIVLTRDRRIVWASPSLLAFAGATAEQIDDLDLRNVIAPDDLGLLEDSYADAEAGRRRIVRLRARTPDGGEHTFESHVGPYVDGSGEVRGVLSSSRIIDDLIHIEQELDHRARFDLLTGLMNRAEVLQKVAQLAGQHPRTGAQTAVLFCDIDRFKEINDSYGHAAGDSVLRALGERIGATIRSEDYAARIGGDEMLVALNGVHDIDEVLTIAEKIRAVAGDPIALDDGSAIQTTLSIGATLMHPGESPDELVERADSAMYEAKAAGRNRVVARP